ncbi:MAG: dicarboxylate/amino acid:cation symporter [Verrucomicrobiota bacterium]
MTKKKRPSLKSLFTGEHALTMQILTAIILAFALVLIAPGIAAGLKIGGDVFLMVLKMMVVPLVVTSVMSGILGLGDVRKLGKPGRAAIGYYLTTTMLAVIMGLVVVNVLQPGIGSISEEQLNQATEQTNPKLEGKDGTIKDILENLVIMLFTSNLISSAAEMDILPLIVFSVLFAAVLTTLGKKVEPLSSVIVAANEGFMATTLVIMKVAPIGIFCLVAYKFGDAQVNGNLGETLSQISSYFGAVLVALAIHALVVLPTLYWFFTRKNPYKFILLMSRALLTAFSTASSSATLPLTMDTAIEKAKISKKSVKFVLPLGATINMDGTALYEAVAAIFIAQVLSHAGLIPALTFADQLVVAITATLAAIGAAGIPEAGLFTMVIVFKAVGLPVEYISLLIPIDWLLDRFRTTVNVFGDAVGAAVVEKAFDAETLLAEEPNAT